MFDFLPDVFRSPFVIPVFAVAIPVIAHYWYKIEQMRAETNLKRAMIERGMSADEIERVLAARSPRSE
jgi:hypothetical protein